ncbi:MAG: hypothetical protein ACOC8D_00135 [bacterium]
MVGRSGRASAVLLSALGAACLAAEPTEEVRGLRLSEVEAELEFGYESEERDRSAKTFDAETHFSDRRFYEIFELAMRGSVYHPRFLTFDAAFGFEIEQVDVELDTPGTRRSESGTDVSPRYSISGTVLPQHPVSLSFGLDRRRQATTFGFGDRVITDLESERVAVHFKDVPVPTRIFYERTVTDQRQSGRGEERDRTIDRFGLSSTHSAGGSETALSYEYFDETEDILDVTGTTPFRTTLVRRVHTATLTNRLDFGPDRKHSLDSSVHYRDEAGTTPSSRFAVQELLRLGHLPNLASHYQVRYDRNEVRGLESDSIVGEVGLTHQLYASLLSRLTVHGARESFARATRDIYGADVAFDYRKQVPHGTLTVHLGAGREWTDEQGAAGVQPVVDESVTLSDTTTTFLANPNVLVSTIVVTDATGTLTFTRGIDYLVIVRGTLTELRRIPSGSIAAGASVLVDYEFEIRSLLTYTTRRSSASARVDLFEHLALYASRHAILFDVASGEETGRLDDTIDTLFGAEATYGPATLTVEHEISDSDQAPFTSDMASLRLQQVLDRVHTVSGVATVRRVEFEQGVGGRSDTRSVDVTYQLAPPAYPSLRVSLGYLHQDDRTFSGDFLRGEVEVLWSIRATQFSASYRFRNEDDTVATEDVQEFFFSVRRRF